MKYISKCGNCGHSINSHDDKYTNKCKICDCNGYTLHEDDY